MTEHYIRYDILTQNALRSVVRTVLVDTAENGLPGEHHFFITFDTRVDGVDISTRLKNDFPTEIRIVLNHQFWDLMVREHDFEVGVSFRGVAERLVVPFAAITRFEDRFAGFDVHFLRDDEEAKAAAAAAKSAPRRNRPAAGKQTPTKAPNPTSAAPAEPGADALGPASQPDDKPPTGGEVVQFDRFRKK